MHFYACVRLGMIMVAPNMRAERCWRSIASSALDRRSGQLQEGGKPLRGKTYEGEHERKSLQQGVKNTHQAPQAVRTLRLGGEWGVVSREQAQNLAVSRSPQPSTGTTHKKKGPFKM